jgi:hypothetical protein
MHSNEEYVAVSEGKIGLDRSVINRHDQIQLVEEDQKLKKAAIPDSQSNTTKRDEYERLSLSQIRSSIKERGHETVGKLKKTLHISKDSDMKDNLASSSLFGDSVTEPSSSRLVRAAPAPEKRTLKDFRHSPIDTVKSKLTGEGSHEVASSIATKEISHGQEVDLINAQDSVGRASTDGEKLSAIENLKKLVTQRQNMFVRWTVDRHITKVRVLPQDAYIRKPKSAFQTRNHQGDVSMDWKAYGHNVSDPVNHTTVIVLLMWSSN